MADEIEEGFDGWLVVLIPAESDPVVAASSQPAHMTTIWFGDVEDPDPSLREQVLAQVNAYALQLDGPVVVPVRERGTLGDEDADVVYLEPTDSLLALRDGLLEADSPARRAHDAVEQYPEWQPHVTLGYPEAPARAEYDGEAVTFDRIGLWVGDEHHDFVMGGEMSDNITADGGLQALRARAAGFDMAGVIADVDPEPVEDEMPLDELEDDEELITEVPVHGVATLEGKPTGDGRGFRPGAISFGRLPAPLGYEFESSHGGDNSRVAVVGRIDEFWTVPSETEGEGVFEVRWRGVIMPGKEYGARAIESIVDGSYDGLSVIVDDIAVDVEDEREALRQRILADRESDDGEEEVEFDIDAVLDELVGDGELSVTWFSRARVRRFDMVPTGAYQEGYTALGHEFADELTEEQLVASAAALEACGCMEDLSSWEVVDLSALTEEQRAEYETLSLEEQPEFAREHGALVAGAFAPGTKDGPGWITHPIPTSRIRRYWTKGAGAAKIGWGLPGDFNRCRTQLAKYVQNPDWLAGLCANMHKEALGVWPGQEGAGRHSLAASAAPGPLFLVASADRTPLPAEFFANPNLKEPTGVTVDGDHIYGHLAAWNVCHIAQPEGPNTCTLAPRSPSNYAHFRTGVIATTAGQVAVGSITMNTGHAGGFDSAAGAVSHYDNTGTVVADVTCGEDNFGIWFSGMIRPSVSAEDRHALAASGRLSGDWRAIGGKYELVAALAVNVPGFPIPRAALAASAAAPLSLVAAGIVDPEPATKEASVALNIQPLDAETVAGIAIAAAEQVLHLQARDQIVAAATPARAALNARALAGARAKITKMED